MKLSKTVTIGSVVLTGLLVTTAVMATGESEFSTAPRDA